MGAGNIFQSSAMTKLASTAAAGSKGGMSCWLRGSYEIFGTDLIKDVEVW